MTGKKGTPSPAHFTQQRSAVQRRAAQSSAPQYSNAAPCGAVVCFFFRTHQKSTRYVRTYHTCMRRRGCSSRAWNSLHLQAACVCTSTFGPSVCCVPFFLVSERSGRNRPPREALCIYVWYRTSKSCASIIIFGYRCRYRDV